MTREVKFTEPSKSAKDKGWEKVKVVHVISGSKEYKEFYYTSNKSIYLEYLYRTTWIKF